MLSGILFATVESKLQFTGTMQSTVMHWKCTRTKRINMCNSFFHSLCKFFFIFPTHLDCFREISCNKMHYTECSVRTNCDCSAELQILCDIPLCKKQQQQNRLRKWNGFENVLFLIRVSNEMHNAKTNKCRKTYVLTNTCKWI